MFCPWSAPHSDSMSATEWSDVDMAELLPTGTVTLLLADVEGSTQLWDNQPEAMTAAIALLNRTASALIAEHGGVRPVEQGEGDSFVAAFARAGDAVRCALDLATRGFHADQASHRSSHRRRAVARRRQLRGHDDQQDRAAARPGTRRPDRHLGRNRGNGRRPASRRRVADRSGSPRVARPPPSRPGIAVVPSRAAQRLPATADNGCRCRS